MILRALGTAQDGGVPQFNCFCENCTLSRNNPNLRRKAASLALIDEETNRFWVIDATPDFHTQLDLLLHEEPTLKATGIFLTHAHIGHYAGLQFLGLEVAHTSEFPVYATQAMHDFLVSNKPFSYLFERHEIKAHVLSSGRRERLDEELFVEPFAVPHRNEDADTMGFMIYSKGAVTCYIPDFEHYTDEIIERVLAANVAILDGTFYSFAELKHRRQDEVPHVTMETSMAVLKDHTNTIFFSHINHSNPVHRLGSAEHRELVNKRFKVLVDGQTIDLCPFE